MSCLWTVKKSGDPGVSPFRRGSLSQISIFGRRMVGAGGAGIKHQARQSAAAGPSWARHKQGKAAFGPSAASLVYATRPGGAKVIPRECPVRVSRVSPLCRQMLDVGCFLRPFTKTSQSVLKSGR
jgi:hypothetical protein